MHTLLKISILLLVLVITSCYKDDQYYIELSFDDFEPELSLAGFVSTDSIYVCLTETKKREYATKYESPDYIETITDTSAKVDIYEDGLFLCTLSTRVKQWREYINGNGSEGDTLVTKKYYVSYHEVDENKEYSLRVEHSKYGIIQAKALLPASPNITIDTMSIFQEMSLELNNIDADIHNFTDAMVWNTVFTITIDDPAEISNYYKLEIRNDSRSENKMFRNSRGYFSSNLLLGSRDNSRKQIIFSDQYFNGKNYNLKFSYFKDSSEDVTIILYSLSKDYFNYLQSVEEYNLAQEDPFSKPVTIFSNVSTNLGIFGAYSKVSFTTSPDLK